jgi:acetoacetyl-CoA reductase
MKHRALVTGGSSGIGSAIAQKLLSMDMEVHIFDVADEQLRKMCAQTGAIGHRVDVSDYVSVEQTVSLIKDTHGPFDVLVNNAGIIRDAFVHKMTFEQWNQVIQVNLTSVFNTVRAIAPSMRELGWGRIVNISSMNGLRGQFGQANYAAAKAGMIGFTKSIAQECANKGITANCIAPGFIVTEMTQAMKPDILENEKAKIPMGRLGTVDDIASAVAYLVKDESSFITGQVLSVNGGQYM